MIVCDSIFLQYLFEDLMILFLVYEDMYTIKFDDTKPVRLFYSLISIHIRLSYVVGGYEIGDSTSNYII